VWVDNCANVFCAAVAYFDVVPVEELFQVVGLEVFIKKWQELPRDICWNIFTIRKIKPYNVSGAVSPYFGGFWFWKLQSTFLYPLFFNADSYSVFALSNMVWFEEFLESRSAIATGLVCLMICGGGLKMCGRITWSRLVFCKVDKCCFSSWG